MQADGSVNGRVSRGLFKGIRPLPESILRFEVLYLASMVAARANGARRLRRFRVAQTRGRYGKAHPRKLRTVKRPEGRAPAQILVLHFINTTTFVASLFGSGEARRGSIPRPDLSG